MLGIDWMDCDADLHGGLLIRARRLHCRSWALARHAMSLAPYLSRYRLPPLSHYQSMIVIFALRGDFHV